MTRCTFVLIVLLQGVAAMTGASQEKSTASFQEDYAGQVRGLFRKFCYECHSGSVVEADLDLEQFNSVAEIQRNTKPWIRVLRMLDTRQMPPMESLQPSDDDRMLLRSWTRSLLENEVRAHAGDPGPVVLRRLNNSEYNYTIGDLTGIESLDPTKEYPVDGAAGEGFINTGDALSMSPNLIGKYLGAGKAVAQHAVFTPTGMRWSRSNTRRNVVDAMMQQIRDFYRSANRTSPDLPYQQQGHLHLRGYLEAIASERAGLLDRSITIPRVAEKHHLNAVYLQKLWDLHQSPENRGHVLQYMSHRLRSLTPQGIDQFAVEMDAWLNMLWTFNVVGHIGRNEAPTQWQSPVNPLQAVVELERAFPESLENDVTVFFGASAAGDGDAGDYVLWKNARLEKEGEPPIYLAHLEALTQRYRKLRTQLLSRATEYLAAVDEASRLSAPIDIPSLATKHNLDQASLECWLSFMNVQASTAVDVDGLVLTQLKNVAGYAAVSGWGSELPNLTANASDELAKIPGDCPPHGITVHPTPTMYIATLWKAPETMRVAITSLVADAHSNCGNGTEFWLQYRSGSHVEELWHGTAGLRETKTLPAKELSVRKGEVIGLYVGPRAGQHVCDLTRIDLTLRELGDEGELGAEGRQWDLAKDCADNILEGNPHADRFGNSGVWHITKGLVEELEQTTVKINRIPAGTILEDWIEATDSEKRGLIAQQIQHIAIGDVQPNPDSADSRVFQALRGLADSLLPCNLQDAVERDNRFGVHPLSGEVADLDLVTKAPSALGIKIPAILAAGRTLKVSGVPDPHHGDSATVQLTLNGDDIVHDRLLVTLPILSAAGQQSHVEMIQALDEFRELFPRALAYVRLVPVDEVVTLVLWFREDQHLARLMLTPDQRQQLDALWDEFLFVAQEPLQYEVAYEQIYQFATQDAPHIVEALKPIAPQVKAYAEAFRTRQLETESLHVDAILDFAEQAWRRDLSDEQRDQLRGLYRTLREVGLNHEPACRRTLARILTSPHFLFKQEAAQQGLRASAVTSAEYASRLSYFLWSSMPDETLRQSVRQNQLTTEEQIWEQTRRMLKDAKTSRMATEFAAQWLHVRDFNTNDDKNEELYPEFAQLRDDMYQETLLFFADLFQNNGSVIDILDADHTFLNETLAKHYGMKSVTGSQWRRVENVKRAQRGGILAMSATLAAQSGASRTSPILRGNWVYETLLGERLPKPPANVPQIPDQVPLGKTARELIELHSQAAECAKCHALIDPYGFSLEQYDALGRLRPVEVDTRTRLIDRTELKGIDGLRDYLTGPRRDDFLRQFCRKLLGFALGREVQLSDKPLIDEMIVRLQADGYRIHSAIRLIVLSKQFRFIRGRDFVMHQ